MKFIVKIRLLLVCIMLLSHSQAICQPKEITLEDIWVKNTFQMKNFEGFQWTKSANQYSKLSENTKKGGYSLDVYEVISGKKIKNLVSASQLILQNDSLPLDIDGYTLSEDETKILIRTSTLPIYRHSVSAVFYVFNTVTQKLTAISGGDRLNEALFSNDGNKLAYTKNNDLFYVDLISLKEVRITSDGKKNEIINGNADWVYEEEFQLVQAFAWSPDSKKLAYYTFDESNVKEYKMQIWEGLYPKDYKFKYPKAGEKNSEIIISVFDLDKQAASIAFNGKGKDIYIPRISWTPGSNILSISKMNRFQDSLQIIHIPLASTSFRPENQVVKTFTSKHYVEINDNLRYLKSSDQWICSDESDGFRHIYLYDLNGKLDQQITKGSWEIADILYVDEKLKLVYYTSKEASTFEEHLYVIDFEGNNKRRLTFEPGVHTIEVNPAGTFFVDYYSELNGNTVSLCSTKDGKILKTLENNEAFKRKLTAYNFSRQTFGSFKNSENIEINTWIIKPVNFDSTKKYPVLLFVYGGPGNQRVLNAWNGRDRLWFEMLSQKGYIIACADNRGTGGKGTAFRNCTTRQLGKLETIDQIDFARYLNKKNYVDSTRIGIFGWSYGGYLSSLCLLLGADVFKMAIAVAPVTNWRFYDTIYTERYLKTPSDNTAGYDDYSPLSHAEKLKGRYLLIHGTGDDNVHVQNSMEMQSALIKAGKQFDSFYYPNKNHGIGGQGTRLHLYKLMTGFIQNNL